MPRALLSRLNSGAEIVGGVDQGQMRIKRLFADFLMYLRSNAAPVFNGSVQLELLHALQVARTLWRRQKIEQHKNAFTKRRGSSKCRANDGKRARATP